MHRRELEKTPRLRASFFLSLHRRIYWESVIKSSDTSITFSSSSLAIFRTELMTMSTELLDEWTGMSIRVGFFSCCTKGPFHTPLHDSSGGSRSLLPKKNFKLKRQEIKEYERYYEELAKAKVYIMSLLINSSSWMSNMILMLLDSW